MGTLFPEPDVPNHKPIPSVTLDKVANTVLKAAVVALAVDVGLLPLCPAAEHSEPHLPEQAE
jgi:hypothetical protein